MAFAPTMIGGYMQGIKMATVGATDMTVKFFTNSEKERARIGYSTVLFFVKYGDPAGQTLRQDTRKGTNGNREGEALPVSYASESGDGMRLSLFCEGGFCHDRRESCERKVSRRRHLRCGWMR